MEHEALVAYNKARMRVAQVRRPRGYFSKPNNSKTDERNQKVKALMAKSPCRQCGELGRWSCECPK